jgi:hypothetical protein
LIEKQDTQHYITIKLNGEDVTSQCGPNNNGVYSFIVNKDGYFVINTFTGKY